MTPSSRASNPYRPACLKVVVLVQANMHTDDLRRSAMRQVSVQEEQVQQHKFKQAVMTPVAMVPPKSLRPLTSALILPINSYNVPIPEYGGTQPRCRGKRCFKLIDNYCTGLTRALFQNSAILWCHPWRRIIPNSRRHNVNQGQRGRRLQLECPRPHRNECYRSRRR